nr:ankyrin repeat domain-containing protein [Candidatus Dependentiae bacterium]
LLLKAGADINVQDEYDETPFNLAIRRKNGEMVKALLEANPDLAIKDDTGLTPLEVASKSAKNIEEMIKEYIIESRPV